MSTESTEGASGSAAPNFHGIQHLLPLKQPKSFDFAKHDEWPRWIKRFDRYRIVSGIHKRNEELQVNAFLYAMGGESEDIMSTPFSDQFQKCPNDFQIFPNDIQKFTCEFQIFPNEINIVLIMNRAIRAGDISVVNLNMFVITLKKARNCLSFWTVLPNMLNTVETILSKTKTVLKQRMRVPQVQPPTLGE